MIDSDNEDNSVVSSECASGMKMLGLECSPEFSVPHMDSAQHSMSPTDNKVSKYLFFSCLAHYMLKMNLFMNLCARGTRMQRRIVQGRVCGESTKLS